MEDKDSFDFRGHADEILLLLIKGVHCLENFRIKDFSFLFKICNKFNIMKNWRNIFLLFKNVFNMDQYVLGIVLGSDNFLATFE